MAKFQITSPDGKKFEVNAPEGASQEDVLAYAQKQFANMKPQEETGILKNLGLGALRGVGGIGASLAQPVQALAGGFLGDNAEMRQNMEANLSRFGADKDSLAYQGGKLGAEVAGTWGVGGLAGRALSSVSQAPKALALAEALKTGGMAKGVSLPVNMAGGAGNAALGTLLIDPENTATGAAIGAAIPVAGATASAIGGAAKSIAEPFYDEGQKQILSRLLRKTTGNEAPIIAERLGSSKPLIQGSMPTAAEVGGSPGLAGLQRGAISANPNVGNELALRQEANNAARLQALQNVTPDRAAAVNARDDITSILRDNVLSSSRAANEVIPELRESANQKIGSSISALQQAGKWQTEAANQSGLADKFYPVQGQPRFPGRYSNNADRVPEYASGQTDALSISNQRKQEANQLLGRLGEIQGSGISELKPDSVINSIEQTLNQPGLRASTVVTKSLGDIKDKISGLVDKNGNIHPEDLYTVRKEIGNIISTHAKDSGNWDKKLTSGLERDIQKTIDNTLEKSSGGGWLNYLDTYKEMSKPISQSDILSEILNKSQDFRGNITPARLNNSANDSLASSVTGMKNATLENTLTKDQKSLIDALRKDLINKDYADTAGRAAGSNTVQNMAYANMMDKMGIPSALSGLAPASALGNVAGRFLDLGYGRANNQLSERLANTLLSPKETAELLKMLPKEKGSKTAAKITPATAALINALSGD